MHRAHDACTIVLTQPVITLDFFFFFTTPLLSVADSSYTTRNTNVDHFFHFNSISQFTIEGKMKSVAVLSFGILTAQAALRGNEILKPLGAAKKNDCDSVLNDKLNILVFYASDFRHDMFGSCHTSMCANAKTPNLDRLIGDSAVFANNYVTTTVDWSSAASFYSGKYTHHHHVYWNTDNCKDCDINIFHAVHRAEYYTGHIGKWGIANDNVLEFVDYSVSYEGWYWQNISGVMWHSIQRNEYDTVRFQREGRDKCFPFFFVTGFFANQALFDDPEQYYPQIYTKAVYEYMTIKTPATYSEEHWNNMPAFFHGNHNRNRAFFNIRFAPEVFQTMSKKIYRLVTEIDHAIGFILDDIVNAGLMDNTMIIFTSSTGMSMGERGLAEKATPYEEAMKTPLIIYDPRMPESKKGTIMTEVTLNIDLAPTIASAAGIKAEDMPEQWQGKDITQAYLTDNDWGRDDFYFEFLAGNDGSSQPTFEGFNIPHKWKYINWNQYDYEQLFDLSSDLDEEFDLARNPDYEQTLVEMREAMAESKSRMRSGDKV